MGEYVCTTMVIGGRVTRATLEALAEQADDAFGGVELDDVLCAVRNGSRLVVDGERNYGNADEMEAFCIKHELAYHLSWCAAPGALGAGAHYWRPGMAEPIDATMDDDGHPVLNAVELRRYITDGKTLDDAIADLVAADSDATPILEERAETDEERAARELAEAREEWQGAVEDGITTLGFDAWRAEQGASHDA